MFVLEIAAFDQNSRGQRTRHNDAKFKILLNNVEFQIKYRFALYKIAFRNSKSRNLSTFLTYLHHCARTW